MPYSPLAGCWRSSVFPCWLLSSGLYWIIRLRDWNAPGQVTWAMTLMTTGLFVIYTFLLTAFSPLNPLSFIFALMFFFLEAITLLMALSHMHESLDVVCRLRWHRLVDKLEPIPGYLPMVSLQVPAYNEPVEVVEKTLNSLAGLNYPDFEVLVVDNNTPLQATWRPLEEICRQAGTQLPLPAPRPMAGVQIRRAEFCRHPDRPTCRDHRDH